MGATKSLRARLSRFVESQGTKPLVGSQIAFAIRTVKEVLNGNGKASQPSSQNTPPGS